MKFLLHKFQGSYANKNTYVVASSNQLPRYVRTYIGITEKSKSIEYHLVCFCDALKMAYATVIYLHQSFGDTYKANLKLV